ncbi:MAG: type II toxin-antitoxin system HicB family antitoxin [Gammaproteobacteria bacterium]|nr:type II toxin-antitoxin system HicB family antitoxin [Gammaproteobacteria bacterium]
MTLTAVFLKVPEGYVAFVEELPGANTQGNTLQEARDNIREAIELTFEANRILAQESLDEAQEVIREPVNIQA